MKRRLVEQADVYVRDRAVAPMCSHHANDEKFAGAPNPGACPFYPHPPDLSTPFLPVRSVPVRAYLLFVVDPPVCIALPRNGLSDKLSCDTGDNSMARPFEEIP